MKANKITQRKWVRGVNAAAQPYAQPQGSFPRGSNLVFTNRGSLLTCDGSQLISALNGMVQPISANIGPITEVFLYESLGNPNTYFAIAKDFNTHVGVPSPGPTVTLQSGGLSGNYTWAITNLDGAGGETPRSTAPTIVTLSAQKASLTWPANAFATSYNVYRTKDGTYPNFFLVATVTTNSYIDNIPDGSLGSQQPPTTDTTQVSQFYSVPITSFGAGNIVKTFPADALPAKDNTGGGRGGSGGGGGAGGGGATSGNQPPTPAGGIVGNISATPQIIQFINKMILALGNGFPPQSSDGSTAGTAALTNSFQATYPVRQSSFGQVTGDLMSFTVGGVAYVFKAIQGGTTAASAPAFSGILNKTVADGSVIWQNIGAVAGSIAPRGAAHAIVYAGSLWVLNTYPTNSTDGLDGPSCLAMSDVNNPNSWNPLNRAFLDKDDGTQGTGLATFTIAESGIPPTGSLVVFKDFSTFQINGVFGASNFSIQRAQTDMGCVAGRTIQFLPGFGIGRMTHLGIAVFDGVRDRLISEEIRPYIFGGQPDIPAVDWSYIYFSKGAQTATPPMYTCAVPVLPSNNVLSGVTVDRTSAIGVLLPAGAYYIKVVEIFANGSQKISPEIGPIVVDSTHCFTVNFPPADPQAVKWRVFFGIGPGNESQYGDVPPTAINKFIIGPGLVGIPGSNQGALTRLLCYDLVLKSWTIIDLPFGISVIKQFRSVGTIPITVMAGFFDGAIRRCQSGDLQWDAGAVNAGNPDNTVLASVRTPQVYGKAASDRVYFRRLSVRGFGTPVGLAAKITTNGLDGKTIATQNFITQPLGGGEFVAYLDIAQSALDAYATIQWIGPLEVQSVDWTALSKAVGGLAVAS